MKTHRWRNTQRSCYLQLRIECFAILTGAALAAVAVATLFTTFGYSGEPTIRDFGNQLIIAVISFGSAAVLVSYSKSRKGLLLDVGVISLLGGLIGFVLRVTILEGANGLPAYITQYTQLLSWKPFTDLGLRCLIDTAVLTVISLPFVAFGAWLCGFVSRQASRETT